ncbi:MAG: HEAT repeat domain-containing protein [Methanomassiliicoccaceae archaeon]|jgi:hypothetical protein|nr:HEAT repeat domain-containing protein [Methanomassiliicoccaceae archaeon]
MSIYDDLLSDDVSVVSKGLDDLDASLRMKNDHSDLLGTLLMLSMSPDTVIVQKVTWCAAKMGQNKVKDKRIPSLLVCLAGSIDEIVRENVAWGIGEAAGTVEMADDCMSAISLLLDDHEKEVRGMAAWAAGRVYHKCFCMDDEIKMKLRGLLNDPSEYVREAAKFALDD